jgi:hypothetical protein
MTRVQKTGVEDGNKVVHLNVYRVIVSLEFPDPSARKRDRTTIFQSCHNYVAREHNADAEPKGDGQIEGQSQTSLIDLHIWLQVVRFAARHSLQL